MDIAVVNAINTWRAANRAPNDVIKLRKEKALQRVLRTLNKKQLAEFNEYTEVGTP